MWIISEIKWDPTAINEQAWTIFIAGIGVVFIVLYVLSLIFILFQKTLAASAKKNQQIKEKKVAKACEKTKNGSNQIIETNPSHIENQVQAAIAMGLHFYLDEQHDDESLLLTIDSRERLSSPWSAKVFNGLQK